MKNLDNRVIQLEKNEAVMSDRIINLTAATKENTDAIRALTSTLSYNKGLVVASAKFASIMTAVIAGGWAVGTWFVGLVNGGSK